MESSSKNLCTSLLHSSRNLSRSKPHYYFFTTLFTLSLLIFITFFSSTSGRTSPVISYRILTSRPNTPAKRLSPPPPPLSSAAHLDSQSYSNGFLGVSRNRSSSDHTEEEEEEMDYCDLFDGKWVVDEGYKPVYEPGSCPFVDDAFNCVKNGRPDSDYIRLRWKPHSCEIPRFDGLKMLEILRGKRMVFVGDSLNRNMWQSLVCSLRESLADKSNVLDVSGRAQLRNRRFFSFKFEDFNCSIDFIKAPFLVQEWKFLEDSGMRRETLRLDVIMEGSRYHDADIVVFNTGHWWTHQKTFRGKYYFQEGDHVYGELGVADAYKKALTTWAKWVDDNVNSSRTRVFFRGYSASHFKGGKWNSGGGCDGETKPITNETQLGPYPWMMRALESTLSGMKTPVFYLNITRMTGYRKDGHPSVFRRPAAATAAAAEAPTGRGFFQDCSHWCLPGVPDSWIELLYAVLIRYQTNIVSRN